MKSITNGNAKQLNTEIKELAIQVQQPVLEEDLDSGLCSANEDSENHKAIGVAPADENNIGNFQSELKFKAKEIREKIRKRDFSRLNSMRSSTFKYSKNNVIHGSLLSERGFYLKRRTKVFYKSELNNFRSFKHKFDGHRLKKNNFEFCSEIKEEEITTVTETLDNNKSDINQLNVVEFQTNSLVNSMESIFHKKAAAATVIATAAAAAASVPTDDETLQKLMDIVMPSLPTNFDLVKTENVAEIKNETLLMHQHLNETSSAVKMDFNSLNKKNPDIEANENIMRTCLGYLDYINKKHTRQRQLQVIRNKISGVVLLTLVFVLVFGLGVIMSIYLVKSLTGVMKSNSEKTTSPSEQNKITVNNESFIHNIENLNSENYSSHMTKNQKDGNNIEV